MNRLEGFTPFPEAVAQRYRELGYWQGQTFSEFLDEKARQFGARTALVCGERRWTYREFQLRAERLAGGFYRLGIQPQDRVVVQLPNVAEFYLVCFALFRLGALPVFALPAHRSSEIRHFCDHAQAVAYVIADKENGFDFRALARDVKPTARSLKHVVVIGDAAEFTALELLYEGDIDLPASPWASDVAFLQLSGGSTGLPKLIPRTHDDYLYSVRASAEICRLSPASVYLCALPVAHNFPFSSPGALGVFHAGGCVVLARQPAPDVCFPLLLQENVSITALVPPLALVWMEAAAQRRQRFPALQWLQVGGARLSEEAACRVQSSLGCRLQQVFGMAEGLVNYTRFDDPLEWVVASQGLPISPDDEIRIVDDEDRELPPGEPGHLLTRGPYTIRGYYRADEHNARAFTSDGFYRTGDIVRRLPSGHLVVEGRAKDQINRGGEKIAAEEVENHLLAHPAVLDVALVAMPDAFLGEKSCAFVIPRGAAPRPIELLKFLREREIASFKIPDRIEFIEQFPQTSVGKVNKRALRERIADTLVAAR